MTEEEKKPVTLTMTQGEYHRILEAQHKSMTKSFAEFLRSAALKEADRVMNAEVETQAAGL